MVSQTYASFNLWSTDIERKDNVPLKCWSSFFLCKTCVFKARARSACEGTVTEWRKLSSFWITWWKTINVQLRLGYRTPENTLVTTSRGDKTMSKDIIISYSDTVRDSCEAVGTNAQIVGEQALSKTSKGVFI